MESPKMPANEPVTVVIYATEYEAMLAVSYLESHGIKATLAGGAPAKQVWGGYYIPPGYMLQVAADDAKRAGRLLKPIIRRQWRRFLRKPESSPLPRWMYYLLVVLAVLLAYGLLRSLSR
jgi:hypothetical protein